MVLVQIEGDRNARPLHNPISFDLGQPIPLGVIPRKCTPGSFGETATATPSTAFQKEHRRAPDRAGRSPRPGDGAQASTTTASGRLSATRVAAGFSTISPLHVAGSDASGIVWAVGSNVRNWRVGDEVVAHCCQVAGDDEECNGGDPMLSPSQRIWGYETSYGAFAQFTRVQAAQLLP